MWNTIPHVLHFIAFLYTFNNIIINIFLSLPFGLTAVIFIGKSSNVISCLSLNSFTKSNISILMYHLFRDTSRTFCIDFHIALSPAFADIFSRPWLIFLYSTMYQQKLVNLFHIRLFRFLCPALPFFLVRTVFLCHNLLFWVTTWFVSQSKCKMINWVNIWFTNGWR